MRAGAPGVATPADADSKTPWWRKETVPNMIDITSMSQFVEVMSANQDSLVILDFYARWCGACKSVHPKLVKLCREHPDIVMLKVNFDDNRQLAKQLGVKVLPFFHVYRGAEGRVAAFSCNSAKFARLREAITEHGAPRCSLGGSVVPELGLVGGSRAPPPADAANNVVAAPPLLAVAAKRESEPSAA